jgi:hypothetical protein
VSARLAVQCTTVLLAAALCPALPSLLGLFGNSVTAAMPCTDTVTMMCAMFPGLQARTGTMLAAACVGPGCWATSRAWGSTTSHTTTLRGSSPRGCQQVGRGRAACSKLPGLVITHAATIGCLCGRTASKARANATHQFQVPNTRVTGVAGQVMRGPHSGTCSQCRLCMPVQHGVRAAQGRSMSQARFTHRQRAVLCCAVCCCRPLQLQPVE